MIGVAKTQTLCAVVLGVLALAAPRLAADTPTPNIVLILADDKYGHNAGMRHFNCENPVILLNINGMRIAAN